MICCQSRKGGGKAGGLSSIFDREPKINPLLTPVIENDPAMTTWAAQRHGLTIKMKDERAAALAGALMANTMVRELNLNASSLTATAVIPIAAVLKTNATVSLVHLALNQLGDSGAAVLANMLAANARLRVLRLGLNQINDEGACALAEALGQNRTLRVLELPSNPIGDVSANAFAHAVKARKVATALLIGGNAPGAFSEQAEQRLKAVESKTVRIGITKANRRGTWSDVQAPTPVLKGLGDIDLYWKYALIDERVKALGQAEFDACFADVKGEMTVFQWHHLGLFPPQEVPTAMALEEKGLLCRYNDDRVRDGRWGTGIMGLGF